MVRLIIPQRHSTRWDRIWIHRLHAHTHTVYTWANT